MARPSRRRILVALALVAAALIVAAFFTWRALSSAKYDVRSIVTTRAYQDPALLPRAWRLPVARTFHHRVTFQSNGSICGPTSVANVFRSLGDPRTSARAVLDDTGYCRIGFCFFGMTLDELADLVRQDGHDARVYRDLTLDRFRALLRDTNDRSVRYIVNFDRGPLFAHGGGHFSPIGGYLEARDLVFVLDVNRDYRPWLVSSERLFRAVDTIDSATGRKRGLLRIR
jgi:hypothetical protein